MTDVSGDHDLLQQLLRRYNEQPEQRQQIVAEIERRFRRPLAVLVLDSSSLARGERSVGVIPLLARQERLERLLGPIVASAGGRLLPAEEDTIVAVFPAVAAAVRTAAAIAEQVSAVNAVLPSSEDLKLAIGIGFGPILVIGPAELHGDELNLAHTLSEELAGPGEILITPAARAALGESDLQIEEQGFSLSGIGFTAYRLARA